jgi:hypothetical protein
MYGAVILPSCRDDVLGRCCSGLTTTILFFLSHIHPLVLQQLLRNPSLRQSAPAPLSSPLLSPQSLRLPLPPSSPQCPPPPHHRSPPPPPLPIPPPPPLPPPALPPPPPLSLLLCPLSLPPSPLLFSLSDLWTYPRGVNVGIVLPWLMRMV